MFKELDEDGNGKLTLTEVMDSLQSELEERNPGACATLVENDVDLDGDGIKDAASIGIRVTTIAAELATF